MGEFRNPDPTMKVNYSGQYLVWYQHFADPEKDIAETFADELLAKLRFQSLKEVVEEDKNSDDFKNPHTSSTVMMARVMEVYTVGDGVKVTVEEDPEAEEKKSVGELPTKEDEEE